MFVLYRIEDQTFFLFEECKQEKSNESRNDRNKDTMRMQSTQQQQNP